MVEPNAIVFHRRAWWNTAPAARAMIGAPVHTYPDPTTNETIARWMAEFAACCQVGGP